MTRPQTPAPGVGNHHAESWWRAEAAAILDARQIVKARSDRRGDVAG